MREFIVAGLMVLCLWGYGRNIVRLCQADFKSPYKEEVFRTVGVFTPPVGVIVGYIDFEEK